MTNQTNVVAETVHYKIEQIEKLAIIKFKPDSPIEELYKLENMGQYFSVDLNKLLGKEITTRLFLFTDNIFSEERFNEFIKTIKIDPDEKINFLTDKNNLRFNALDRFTNIKHRFIKDCLESDKLNIFAHNGSSIGLWLSTILSGDYSIVAENSQFTFPFLEDDILPLGGLIYYLDKYVSKAALDELLLLGKPINSDDLLKWGLVNKVVNGDTIEQDAIKIALEISNKSHFFIQRFKHFKHRLNGRLLESLDLEHEIYSGGGLRRF